MENNLFHPAMSHAIYLAMTYPERWDINEYPGCIVMTYEPTGYERRNRGVYHPCRYTLTRFDDGKVKFDFESWGEIV